MLSITEDPFAESHNECRGTHASHDGIRVGTKRGDNVDVFSSAGEVRGFVIRPQAVLCAALILLTFAVFRPLTRHRFLEYDDGLLVTRNPHVYSGLQAQNVAWAFTSFSGANWIPVARLSHMLDMELFGLDAGRHHLVNLLLHALNVLLLFGVLSALTGSRWRSALVAALFAVHPLHVESVSWVAERKDVLCALFGLLAVRAYIRQRRKPGRRRLAAVSAFLALGLMSKPMLVTLPFVLLLLDWWPLGRIRRTTVPGGSPPARFPRHLLTEKAPLFGLSIASCLVTLVAQSRGGAITSLDVLPAGVRIANAAIAYAAYLGKLVWPTNLAIIYPVNLAAAWLPTAGAAVLLAGITALAVIAARRRPYLLAGWLWYCGMLVPVSGLVQVGLQSMADRYTYLPLIGVFIALAWVAQEAAARTRRGTVVVSTLCLAALGVLAVLARAQVGLWRDDGTLFEHAVSSTTRNYVAMNNLGTYLAQNGAPERGLALLRDAVRVSPGDSKSWSNLGMILARGRQLVEAESSLRTALRLNPNLVVAHNNLGIVFAMQGGLEDARQEFQAALKLQPDYADGRSNLARIFELQGRWEQSRDTYQLALRDDPHQTGARLGLERVLRMLNSREKETP